MRAILATSPVEQPAAAPADERTTTFDEWLERYVTETGGRVFPPDALRACWHASAAAAKETGAEGATDLRERARLAADQWANPGTSIPQRTAYRDGFIDGASSPAIAAQAVAAWLHRDDPRDCISDAKKRDMIEHAGSGGRRLAENYSIGLCRLDALPAMAAAAPADGDREFHIAAVQLVNDMMDAWQSGTPYRSVSSGIHARINALLTAPIPDAAAPSPADELAAFEAWYERTCPISAEALRTGACDESIQESRNEMALGFSAGVAYARAAASPAASGSRICQLQWIGESKWRDVTRDEYIAALNSSQMDDLRFRVVYDAPQPAQPDAPAEAREPSLTNEQIAATARQHATSFVDGDDAITDLFFEGDSYLEFARAIRNGADHA
ncbi:hypothetical protein WL77_11950 [Burkholderia ubonensis]|nr:hypothetical protein WL77_11950 [Burkholderia ubonensis]